jgi:hypothetical protein
MRKSKFSESQIVGILKAAEAGIPTLTGTSSRRGDDDAHSFGGAASVLTLACWAAFTPSLLAQPIPNPIPVGPGCWEWHYDPTKPIPSNAKVVPGVCPTPDGRCYVVPSSGCFELTGVERPLFDERPTPPALPVPPPPGPPTSPPRAPYKPVALRPRGPTPSAPTPLPEGGQCSPGHGWDFETFLDNRPGEIRGYADFDRWTGGGVRGVSPFLDLENRDVSWKAAPVYGNAVPIQRIKPPGWLPQIESEIGGDYWRFSQDVNQHGDFWIGSMDRRYSWKHQPGEMRDTWGEEARGTLTSPSCTLQARYLTFRLGGSDHGSQRVEVHVRGAAIREYYGVRLFGGPGDPSFRGAKGFPTQFASPSQPQDFPPPEQGAWTVVRSAHPANSGRDWMQIFVFDLAPFAGREVRIRIVDDRRDECARLEGGHCVEKHPEHLLADDFVFTDAPPDGNVWMRHSDGLCGGSGAGAGCSPIGLVASEPPLWGTTDVHAHPMANLSFGGHVFWGDVTDTLDQVYDCSQPLPAIPGNGGRPAIAPSQKRTSCYLSGSVVATATGVLSAGCQVLNVVPFAGPALAAACTAIVAAAAATATAVPVISGASLHGASKMSSGAVKMGALFSGVLNILPDLSLDFETGLIPQMDSVTKAVGTEADGWWQRDTEWHSPTGEGRTHNAYQADMIRRAYNGGLRLAVWDVINARAFDLAVDGEMHSDWQALKDGADAARRIVSTRINDIASIALSPGEAEDIIRSGRLAVILGTEVDELGRMRPQGLAWPLSPHSGSDSMAKQVDDLWELGIRKITPVHATNNPIGGAALFTTVYDANNFFVSGTSADGSPSYTDLPDVPFFLDGTFGSLLAGLFLGDFSFIHDVVHPSAPAWNPTDFFDFDLRATRPEDAIIGDYERVTYRIGIDSYHDPSLRNSAGWKPPSDILGKQVLRPQLIKGLALAVTGPTCNLKDTTLPEPVTSFGPVVDAHYVQVDGHRNVRGLFRAGGEDGETFLRAAMKRGMLLDTDHLSMNTRLDVYELADRYAQEARWPRCTSPDGRSCGGYPFVGVHSKVRTLEIDPKSFEEMRNAYGYNDEASKTEREIRYVAENFGAFAVFPTGSAFIPPSTTVCTKDSDCANYNGPGSGVCSLAANLHGSCVGVNAALVPRTIELAPEVHNDCDSSSKTFATKYLWLLGATGGRGLTPSTDFNGLISTLKPRYGTAIPWNRACAGDDRDQTDQARAPGQHPWYRMMVDSQAFESSGVWYDDYATRGPVPSPVGTLWGDTRYKQVVARRAADAREDRAPRAHVDDLVYFNDFGPDNARQRGYKYQDGNRVGAQMYVMHRWRVLPGRAGWDYNLDGLQHIGLYPDLFQDMRNVGVQWEQMGPLFHAARDYLTTWRRGVKIGADHP